MFQCDTKGEAAYCGECPISEPHHCYSHSRRRCKHVDSPVTCIPVPLRAHDAPCETCGASRDYQNTMGRTCAEDFHPTVSLETPRVDVDQFLTHTCYYCHYEGTDVNRIHTVGSKKVLPVYCCDDGNACDARTGVGEKAFQDNVAEPVVSETIRGFILDEHLKPGCLSDNFVDRATERIMGYLKGLGVV